MFWGENFWELNTPLVSRVDKGIRQGLVAKLSMDTTGQYFLVQSV
jgi:hypothetical protein